MGSFMKKLWNDWGPLFVALLIAIGIICAIHYTDYPEKWFRHDMSCDGSIGGGCACTDESDSILCNIKNS
jgi:hypothetical protein